MPWRYAKFFQHKLPRMDTRNFSCTSSNVGTVYGCARRKQFGLALIVFVRLPCGGLRGTTAIYTARPLVWHCIRSFPPKPRPTNSQNRRLSAALLSSCSLAIPRWCGPHHRPHERPGSHPPSEMGDVGPYFPHSTAATAPCGMSQAASLR